MGERKPRKNSHRLGGVINEEKNNTGPFGSTPTKKPISNAPQEPEEVINEDETTPENHIDNNSGEGIDGSGVIDNNVGDSINVSDGEKKTDNQSKGKSRSSSKTKNKKTTTTGVQKSLVIPYSLNQKINRCADFTNMGKNEFLVSCIESKINSLAKKDELIALTLKRIDEEYKDL